jgi:hypothetical protein
LGRWFNHTVSNKDRWIEENCEEHVQERIGFERNGSLHRKNQNEYGDPGRIKRRFYKRPDCVNAYRNLFCWTNFPRCDPERDLTLPTCRSSCENFFKSCLYRFDLWRCGPSKYFNGYMPEKPVTDANGNITYLRDYFPGQPFRENKFNRKGSELPVCTPAIRGAASSFTKLTISSLIGYMSVLALSSVLLW